MTVGELRELLSNRNDNEEVYVETTWFPNKASGVKEIVIANEKAIVITKGI